MTKQTTNTHRFSAVALAALFAACSGEPDSPIAPGLGAPSESGTVDANAAEGGAPIVVAGSDAGANLSGADAALPPPTGLPFSYVRSPAGTPVSASELSSVTDTYIDLLDKTRYFAVLDERLHGWPASDPQGRYWFSTWWSGTGIRKENGVVTYFHLDAGAENNGQRTAPILDGTCFASKLWGAPLHEALTRRMMRGFTAWMMAMERQANDPFGPILARSHYPESIVSHDGARDIVIDYAADRPGKPGGGGGFIHVPNNPHWGDIWVENIRSKDDIGHMLVAIGALADCSTSFTDTATIADYNDMVSHYAAWARKVEDDGWAIATLDENLQRTIPLGDLAHFYNLGGGECTSMLSLRLFGRQNPGTVSCGNGVNAFESYSNSNAIVQSFHEAAASHALLTQQFSVAQPLLTGLASRIETNVTAWEKDPTSISENELAMLISLSSTLGVPITWREVRFVHRMIQKAHDTFVTQKGPWEYKVFDPASPDGSFPFEPAGFGFRYTALALPIGSCVARFRNPTSNPLVDCAKLKAWTP